VSIDLTRSLTRQEVEGLVATTRQVIQTAIDRLRAGRPVEHEVRGLRTGADLVAELGRDLLGQRPRLTSTTLKSAMNLRLLAHILYGDHTRADELRELNPGLAKHGPLVPAGTEVKHYAW